MISTRLTSSFTRSRSHLPSLHTKIPSLSYLYIPCPLSIHTSTSTTFRIPSHIQSLTTSHSLHKSSCRTHTRTATSLITRTCTIPSHLQPTRITTSYIIPKHNLTRSFASQGQGQRDDRGGGGISMPVFQIGLTILRVIFRALPWIWRSPFVQHLCMKHPYFLYGVVLLPAGLTFIYVATHIEFVPYSGRIHLTFLNRASEMQLGNEAYHEIMTREHARILPADHPTTVAIREIASDLLNVCIADGIVKPPAPGQPILVGPGSRGTMHTSHNINTNIEPAWEVNVIESTVANAFVLPNGKIFVYTGLLPITQTTGGLASVMGHEISHQLGRHAVEKMGIVALLLLGYELVQGYRDASGNSGRGLGGMAANFLLATIVHIGLPLAHSRRMETEADRIGMTLMSRAAYDPKTAIRVWERMKVKEEKGVKGKDIEQVPEQAFGRNWRVRGAELLSTHPASETRIANMLRWLDSVRTDYITAVDRRMIERLPIPDSHHIIHHVPLLPSSIVKAMDEQPDAQGLTTSLRADRASSLMVGRWGEVFDQVLHELQHR